MSVGSIVYQLTILTVNSDDAEVIGKTQATYIFGILIIFTFDNIVSILEFRDRKQRAGCFVNLRRYLVEIFTQFVDKWFAASCISIIKTTYSNGGFIITSVLSRGPEGIFTRFQIGNLTSRGNLYWCGGKNIVIFQIPCIHQLPCYAYFGVGAKVEGSLRLADIAADGRIDRAPVGYIWSHSYESIVDADGACINSENRKESDFAS